MATIQDDYAERVYAGVLGKIIGVYLGRPFEGWTYDRIMAELGEIEYYVHDRLGKALVVTDDDISGTSAFLRALPDHGASPALTPAQIGESWLNYIIERKTILWWGGLGVSTEHTAYLRLKHGVQAPESGSIALNGKILAEQIGAQIFIDGWAMVAPGDPELAADLARRAASVSHDGAAVHGAQVVAAMEALAFVESDIGKLIDGAVALIPPDSVIQRLIHDVRELHAAERDWRVARERIAERYGYDRYGGACHMVPNHALIIHSLLYGEGDFDESLKIVNTSGWDTDCNSGNVGCLLGIRGGLGALEGRHDWRGPVADRMYVAAAEGGGVVTDALTEAYQIAALGRTLAGLPIEAPKGGARFHFEQPGSVQGFRAEDPTVLEVLNVEGRSESGARSLALRYDSLGKGVAARAGTATFILPEAREMPGYALMASPTLYPGQTVRARVVLDPAASADVHCRLYVAAYGPDDELESVGSPAVLLRPGGAETLEWKLQDATGKPIAVVGLEVEPSTSGAGTVYLDYLGWDGEPDVEFGDALNEGAMQRRAWMQGVDQFDAGRGYPYRLVQNEGLGHISTGTRMWRNYSATAPVVVHLAASAGLGVRVQGMRRYYALMLGNDGKVRLVKALDGLTTLAEAKFDLEFERPYSLSLSADGARQRGWVDGDLLLEAEDADLDGGGVALLCEAGCISVGPMRVEPVAR